MVEQLLEMKTNEALLQKLAQAKAPGVQERREQRVSFVFGSLSEKNTMTRAQIREMIENNV